MAQDELNELDIAVLCGGPGAEAEISRQSGTAVHGALREAGLRARLVELAGTAEEIERLRCDAAFLALHGEWGEDGTVQELLARRGIPFTGSDAAASAVAIDKKASKRKLAEHGIPVAYAVTVDAVDEAIAALSRNGLRAPVVVKPNSRGSSVGTSIVRAVDDLVSAVEQALSFDAEVMIETYIDGREFTVGLLGGEPLPVIELETAQDFYTYEAKYRDDRTRYFCPAPLDEETARRLREIAVVAGEVLAVRDMGRVDILVDDEGPRVLEVNTIPGFTAHSLLPMAARAAGIDFPQLCRRILALAWRRSQR